MTFPHHFLLIFLCYFFFFLAFLCFLLLLHQQRHMTLIQALDKRMAWGWSLPLALASS